MEERELLDTANIQWGEDFFAHSTIYLTAILKHHANQLTRNLYDIQSLKKNVSLKQ